ncbi:hypothetical protein ACF1AY_18710 [Streptomyces sp. NPDC014776]|uniref:hypothetical protein n=1 Tax=Streptomyces sp. NPDC014776 TaxID=3364909 RepID=UPI0036F9B008
MTTPGSHSQSGSGKSLVEGISNLLGFLVAAFVGAVNLFGLRSGELSAILRNEAPRVTVVFGLMLATTAVALASLYFPENERTLVSTSCGWFAFCLAIFTLSLAFIPIPAVTEDWILNLLYAFTSLLLLVAAILFLARHRLWPSANLPLKLVLISCSIILLSAAVLAAARLETRSQVQATYPQLGATIKVANGVGDLSMKIAASKMRARDQVLFWVEGLRRSVSMDKRCGGVWAGNCILQTCDEDVKGDKCRNIASGAVNSDAMGRVEQEISTLFSAHEYQLLIVKARMCEVTGKVVPECKSKAKHVQLYLGVADP